MITTSKVSIVLPVYNGEKYIQEAIDSVIAQTYSNWELIIVNDCSTDNTEQIIHRAEQIDSRIIVYNNAVNLKLPSSLNVGFEHATGDYYTWTSDDNILRPGMLERLVGFLDENEDCGLVYSNSSDIDEYGEIVCYNDLNEPSQLLYGNQVGASFMYRRSVALLVGGYDPQLFLAEDYDYWLRILEVSTVNHICDDLYLYRRHSDSLTETKGELVSHQVYRTFKKNSIQLLPIARETDGVFRFYFWWFAHTSAGDRKEMRRYANDIQLFRIYNFFMRVKGRITRIISK